MTTKTTKKKARGKLSSLKEGAKAQEVLPPEIHDAKLPAPASLDSVNEIRAEMSRVYKLVWQGKILLADATKLAYYLDKMIQAIKTEVELNTIQAAYAKAWGGVAIIADEEVIDGEYTNE